MSGELMSQIQIIYEEETGKDIRMSNCTDFDFVVVHQSLMDEKAVKCCRCVR